MCRSTFPYPRHYFEMSGKLYSPAALPPITTGYEAGWVPEPVWTTQRREISLPERDSNSDLSAIQPVGSRYADYAIPALYSM
jgi:hypothetical protein